VEYREFSSDVQAVDMTQVPIVDQMLAANLADKKLGERPSLGSQVRLGEPTIQLVNGKLIWVVPLDSLYQFIPYIVPVSSLFGFG